MGRHSVFSFQEVVENCRCMSSRLFRETVFFRK